MMLRYLLKTLLQMNLFADSISADSANSTDPLFLYNASLSTFGENVTDIGNLTYVNGSRLRLEDAAPRVIEHPSDLIVSKGEPATLNCKAEGRPTPIIEWYKDGERVETDKDDPRSHRMLLPSGSLFFLRIVHGRRSKPDEGVYVCLARNYLGEAVSRNASLEVAILRDEFRQAPSDVVVAAGEPAVMECLPPRGHPEPTISWKKSNVHISDKEERITIRGGKLMISNTRKSDAGIYICVATNMVGERDSEPAELVVFERPTFIKRPVNQVVLADDTVDFHCEVHGDPMPTTRWRKEEGELPRERVEIQSDNSLRLARVGSDDEGTYTCIAENSVGKVEFSGTLTVHVPPQIIVRPRDQIVAQGRSVTFLCETKGNPPPAVFWQKEGSQILLFPSQPHPLGRFSVSSKGELTITDVQSGDSGYYMCQAISVAGSILSKALLEVEDVSSDRTPPIIRQGPGNQTLGVDSTAQLQCHVMGNPLPSVHWLKDGQRILGNDPRVSMLDNGTLQVTNVQVSDTGMYICVATGSSGETTWSGYLAVQESGSPTRILSAEPDLLPGPPSKPVITDVTRNSVTLTWQPSQHIGGSAVTSYIIEAFSQSAGSTWQTVGEYVKVEKHTVTGLNFNTIYLFIVRAVNTFGLGDPSPISEPVRTQDVSPTGQGVDHRQVQRELGEMAVQLQPPVTLTSTTIQVTWTVDRQAQFIQGYRVMYRTKTSAWLVLDVKSPAERTTILVDLKKGTEYEIKIRPYFDEFQGMDSDPVTVRTPEEAPAAPPQAVTVATIGLSNSTSISVSWEPPPAEEQNGIIQEYRIWCLGNDTRFHVNKSIDGTVLSTVVRGLIAGVLYHVEVAAATSAGVGVRSQPATVLISLPSDQESVPVEDTENVSLAEQITDVVKKPAFIAGIGGACWVILMGFSVWLYCRRKKRKELSHYTASFAYTPAVAFPPAEGAGITNSRPGILNANVTNYPWLADSWPASNLMHNSNGKETSASSCIAKHEATERFYNDAGISNYIAQTEKFGTITSDGPIYSTIDSASDELRTFNGAFPNQQTTLYASTPVVPLGVQNQYTADPVNGHWGAQPGPSNTQYSQPERGRQEAGGKTGKQKLNAKSVKATPLNWTDLLPPPPPSVDIDSYDDDEELEYGPGVDDWCPPLPERTYLVEGASEEEGPPPPPRGEASSPATSYGQQSTATLTPSPREEARSSGHGVTEDIPRLHQFEIPHLHRRLPVGPVPLPRPPTPPPSQSHSSGNGNEAATETAGPHRHGHKRNPSQTMINSSENVNVPGAGKTRLTPVIGGSNINTPPSQKARAKKKAKQNPYRRDISQGDLPPPPEPPPADGVVETPYLQPNGMETSGTSLDHDGSASSTERRPSADHRTESAHPHSRAASSRHKNEDDLIPYSKPTFLQRGQVSSNCSTTGSSSSRGSTGSRGHVAGRSKGAGVDRSEVKR
ncbi:roundabout homolog 3 isoform X1 [Leucoraja erinacea]|uniref:roundabout homolog 3 isoform X1 n=1 Tax=Leucoraja erinaceus TaxID=7782 RepID=UPI002456C1B4|nr:roundabout homolog 3 isoform X1 [Leucoraja erinacea]